MSIQELNDLKVSFAGGHFRRDILNTLVDEIVALDGRVEAKGVEIDELDTKIDELEARVEALEG
jgi:hypothetical protein